MMSFGMSDEHTSYQMHSVRDQVAQCRGRSAHADSPSQGQAYLPRLRSRVGFTLVAAGLRLLPVEGPRQHGWNPVRRSARGA